MIVENTVFHLVLAVGFPYLMKNLPPKKFRYWLLIVNTFCISYNLLYTGRIPYGTEHFGLIYWWNSFVIASLFASMAFRNRVHAIFEFYFFIAVSLTAYFSQTPISWPITTIGVYLLTSNIQIISYRVWRSKLINDFREKQRYIPQQVIRHSIKSQSSLATIYQAEVKKTVCLSSDWRKFQSASKQLPPDAIGNLLSAYYQNISDILNDHFPDGNFFYDWIADELFCVIFETPTMQLPELVNDSLKFSQDLLRSRIRFEINHGLPTGIDVGLAAGLATIGMFGPMGQVKATAFGEVPGRFRRIQTVGKALREGIDNQDRILFGQDIAQHCRGDLKEYQEFQLESGIVRDIDDTKIFFLDGCHGAIKSTDQKSKSKSPVKLAS